MGWLAALALAEGRRAGLFACTGIAIGLMLNALAAAFGLASLINLHPEWLRALRWGGVAMMAWLALAAWRDARLSDTQTLVARTPWRHLGAGLLVNLLNPKAAVFFLLVVPEFLDGPHPTITQSVAMAMASVGIATLVHLGLVLGAGRAHDWLTDPRRMRMLRRAMAVMIAAVALWMLAEALRA
ncbi:LysE family transporter [Novosphingobium sp. FSY-8]|uniref:LysE family transporter n=2 Tax=Novosphingobium ovatum TaxID=1908523 RepID=A0ABW9XDG0_9SPHN|nr:LysE family transporter [Novosphingobium ovatum]